MPNNQFGFHIKPIKIKPLSFNSDEPRRKPIKTGLRTNKLADSGAKCQKCRGLLKGLKPHIHHKNGNPRDNRPSNLIVVCPNCHSKLHRNMKPQRPKQGGSTWWNPETGKKEKFKLF